jgi:hypothetical protein
VTTEMSADQVRALPWPARFVPSAGADTRRSRNALARLNSAVWTVVRLLAASSLDMPWFEAKLAIGEAVHALAEVAASCEERIAELGARLEPRDRMAGEPASERLASALALPAAQRLAALPGSWLAPLLEAFHAAAFDPLLDGPSERVRHRAVSDLRHAFTWFFETAGHLAAAAPAEGAAAVPPAGDASARRPTMGARDARFRTFENTRDYRKAPDWVSSGSDYADDLLELLRVNRDEIDALETFALALFDLVAQAPLEVLRHLARLAWDEARHSACGHALIAERFGNPYRYECSMIGIRVRGEMGGWDAWTQITLFGELGIIGPMRALAREAARRGDERTAGAFGFICSDETMHLRESRRLLARHHPLGSLTAAGDAARARAGRTLEKLGLYEAEQFAELDERQIFELLGE